jgi:2-polyprenyl-6-methoxyphenol hydroxylase-like FAD-dependent oxidoreductase
VIVSDASGNAVTEVPVLVIGGSLVGLAAAMFLAKQGVQTLSVEKHRGTAIHPRAGYFQLRTLELMREGASRAKCARPPWRSITPTAA